MAQSPRQRRKARRRSQGAAAQPAAPPEPKRSEVKNQAVRDALEPLAPGQRPTAVTVAFVVVVLLAVANLVAFVLGAGVTGVQPSLTYFVVYELIMAGMAYGLWRARYWAVLGLQTLLAIAIIFASLGLVTATSWWAAVLLVLIIVGAGTLFWFMVKAMARIQMPERPGASSRR